MVGIRQGQTHAERAARRIDDSIDDRHLRRVRASYRLGRRDFRGIADLDAAVRRGLVVVMPTAFVPLGLSSRSSAVA